MWENMKVFVVVQSYGWSAVAMNVAGLAWDCMVYCHSMVV